MAKVRSQYVCQNCGTATPQWLGQCPSCKEWNSLVEEVRDRTVEKQGTPLSVKGRQPRPIPIHEIPAQDGPRIRLNDRELGPCAGRGVGARQHHAHRG
jgi:DNA repair protein RadA/Sms